MVNAPSATLLNFTAILALGTIAGGRHADSDVAETIQAIAESQAKLPRDRIDPAAIVALCSGEPAKLHAWVRTNTRAVAYRGVLRGPLGVLMDRSGNAFDRALLLGHLLTLAGFEARIASAALPAKEPAEIVETSVAPTPASQPQGDADPFLANAQAIGAKLVADLGALPEAAPLEAEATHAWVQYQDANGWVDLDPSLETAGKRRAEPEGTPFAVELGKRDPKTFAKLAHTVTLRLSVERWEGGKLIESTLFVTPFDSTASPLAAAALTFAPVDPKTLKASQRAADSGAQLRAALLEEAAWTPVLVDGKNGGRMARMFDAAGKVGDLPKGFTGAGELGAAARNVFGGLGGEPAAPAEAASVLTALAADYVIQVPGAPPRTIRRFVFDSLGAGAREKAKAEALPRPIWTEATKIARGAELAAVQDSLITFASVPVEAYLHRFAQRVLDSKAAALRVEKGAKDAPTLELVANGASFRTLELFAAARDQHVPWGLAVAEPQVFRRIVRGVPNTNRQALELEVVSDLVWNRLARTSEKTSRGLAITQGVLDTLQEAIVTFRTQAARPGDCTPALFAEAEKQGIASVVLRTADAERLAPFPVATRTRLAADLAAGFAVVVPEKPVAVDGAPRLGWWRIDLATGQTIGVMDTGLLQDFVEYTETEEVSGIRITHFRRVRVPPEAREWAQRVIQQRSSTSWQQWNNLLTYATRAIMNGRGAML